MREAPRFSYLWDQALFLALIVAVLIASIGLALAHSWYPLSCCSERDCAPVEAHAVEEVRGGWRLEDGTFIPYARARPSPDGRFHVCRHQDGQGALIRKQDEPDCFWAPMGAS
jgi:hypothetical protein